MQKLSDFKPLSHLSLPDLGQIDCSGLIVVVGPNSSGKSQLLHDLHKRLTGEHRALVVASSLRLDKPNFEQFLECLALLCYLLSGGFRWKLTIRFINLGLPMMYSTAMISRTHNRTWGNVGRGASSARLRSSWRNVNATAVSTV